MKVIIPPTFTVAFGPENPAGFIRKYLAFSKPVVSNWPGICPTDVSCDASKNVGKVQTGSEGIAIKIERYPIG